MKTRSLLHLILGGTLLLAGPVEGQYVGDNINLLYSFANVAAPNSPNLTGAYPSSGLALSNNVLLGFSSGGGAYGSGDVYALNVNGLDANGNGFTNLFNFDDPVTDLTQNLGIYPRLGLTLVGSTIYGVSYYGTDTNGYGNVFSIHVDGSGYQVLHEFTGMPGDGASPVGDPLIVSNILYGTTMSGGTRGYGTIYQINLTNGQFSLLHDFQVNAYTDGDGHYHPDLSDGGEPTCSLVAIGSTLYGTCMNSGAFSNGAVFSLSLNGQYFTLLHSFAPYASPDLDGYGPAAGLTLLNGMFYGTTFYGGQYNNGVVFSISPDGTSYSVLQQVPTSWGGQVMSPLVPSKSGKLLYGSSLVATLPNIGAGFSSGGTIFSITPDGTSFSVLHAFGSFWYRGGFIDGSVPTRLLRVGKTLYGACGSGGTRQRGNVYSLALGLAATTTANPTLVHTGDQIQVNVTVANTDEDPITRVQLAAPVSYFGTYQLAGVASLVSATPVSIPTLAPTTSATFNYVFLATNWGAVSFQATAIGTSSDGPVSSLVATSAVVNIVPRGDLSIKLHSQATNLYQGINMYQKAAQAPQILVNSTSINQVSSFDVQIVNKEQVPMDYTLLAATTNTGWTNQYLLAGQDVSQQIGNALNLQTLQPGGSTVLTIYSGGASTYSTNAITVTLGLYGQPQLTLDQVMLVPQTVPVPVTLSLHRMQINAFTSESLLAGLSEGVDQPLAPVTDAGILASQPTLSRGLVADGVTPMLIEVDGNVNSLQALPNGRTFDVMDEVISATGTLNGADPLSQVYDPSTGTWNTEDEFTLTAAKPTAFILVGPIDSDNVIPAAGDIDLMVKVTVSDSVTGSPAGSTFYAIRKPPIFLTHGYASPGFWDPGFVSVLAQSRESSTSGDPDNFVVTIRYGQDPDPTHYILNQGPMPVYMNAVLPLADCAALVNAQFQTAQQLINQNWAMTHPDIVCHSQGGVITRMLCSQNANGVITQPYRNSDNLYRGRFHRVITIGSPHNGSRLLSYLLDIRRCGSLSNTAPLALLTANIMVWIQIAQEKFDPWGPQIRDLNNPSSSGNWYPDSAAQFHLIRAVTDYGQAPQPFDTTPAYQVMDLVRLDASTAVIPRGSDGVVDYDSMLANVPPGALMSNTYDMPISLLITHAAPIFLFGGTINETASPDIAQHVIDCLNQTGEPPQNMQFGSFVVPPLLSLAESNLLYGAATGYAPILFPGIQTFVPAPETRPRPMDVTSNTYSLAFQFPSNEPPAANANVKWVALTLGTNGIGTNGVTWQAQGTNDSQVTVYVDQNFVGDVLLCADYLDSSNQMVEAGPTLVCSQSPSAASLTGFYVLPCNPTLTAGATVPVSILAAYSDGSYSLRYVASNSLAAVSSNPNVVSVSDPLNWQLLTSGTAQVTASWSGFTFTNQVTVIAPGVVSPQLSINAAGTNAVLNWPYWANQYVLEFCTNLALPNWQPVSGGLQTNGSPDVLLTNGGSISLTVPLRATSAYFQLAQ